MFTTSSRHWSADNSTPFRQLLFFTKRLLTARFVPAGLLFEWWSTACAWVLVIHSFFSDLQSYAYKYTVQPAWPARSPDNAVCCHLTNLLLCSCLCLFWGISSPNYIDSLRSLLGLSFENLLYSNDSIMLAMPNAMKTDDLSQNTCSVNVLNDDRNTNISSCPWVCKTPWYSPLCSSRPVLLPLRSN